MNRISKERQHFLPTRSYILLIGKCSWCIVEVCYISINLVCVIIRFDDEGQVYWNSLWSIFMGLSISNHWGLVNTNRFLSHFFPYFCHIHVFAPFQHHRDVIKRLMRQENENDVVNVAQNLNRHFHLFLSIKLIILEESLIQQWRQHENYLELYFSWLMWSENKLTNKFLCILFCVLVVYTLIKKLVGLCMNAIESFWYAK